ncbi:IS5 family transposase [Streptomyces globisporus]|uniref:IS5 family transposase n=1 Tax=Streptomyces globisporus TaxID=1908 RepID=UPI00379FE033
MPQFFAVAAAESSAVTHSCDCLAHQFGNAGDNEVRERRYPTDMSDAEWAVVRPLLPMPGWLRGRGGHPEAYCHRTMLDAVRYLVDNGTKWRAIPADFPPWDRVYAFFRRWRDHGLVKEFHDRLRLKVREQAGRDPQPSAGVIDSQSVKADAVVGAGSRGFDGGKLINGRKRHAVVDTLGLLLGVMVTAADIGDRAAAQVLLAQVAAAHHRLALVWADGGYTGSLVEHCRAVLALVLAIVRRSDDMGPTVQPLGLQRARVHALTIRAERLRSAEHAVRQLTIDPADDRALLIEAVQDRARRWYGRDDINPARLRGQARRGTKEVRNRWLQSVRGWVDARKVECAFRASDGRWSAQPCGRSSAAFSRYRRSAEPMPETSETSSTGSPSRTAATASSSTSTRAASAAASAVR